MRNAYTAPTEFRARAPVYIPTRVDTKWTVRDPSGSASWKKRGKLACQSETIYWITLTPRTVAHFRYRSNYRGGMPPSKKRRKSAYSTFQ